MEVFGTEHGMRTRAWSPIGGITYRDGLHNSTLDDPVITLGTFGCPILEN